jgi:tetratricopeptide (TPR) repeat protein
VCGDMIKQQSLPVSTSKLLSALHQFTAGKPRVVHPLVEQFGQLAYDHLIAGDACKTRQEYSAATQHYQDALNASRYKMTEAWCGLADAAQKQGKIPEALRAYQRALRLTPGSVDLRLAYADFLLSLHRLSDAIGQFQRVLQREPNQQQARFGWAAAEEARENSAKAIRLYQDILADTPDFIPARFNLASLLLKLGLFQRAEKEFRALTDQFPHITSRAYLGLAMALDRQGKRVQARQCYLEVLTRNPNSMHHQTIVERLEALGGGLEKPWLRRVK